MAEVCALKTQQFNLAKGTASQYSAAYYAAKYRKRAGVIVFLQF
jgi:hypothetical protein